MFFGAVWLLLIAAGRTRLFRDPGTFWHILTGDRILTAGLPRTDWLTFTQQGKPWIAHQWLAEVVMSALHRLGGFDALLLTTSGVLALLFAWLFARCLRAGVVTRWSVVICALGILASVGHFHVRPLIASIVFFAWTFACLCDVEQGRSSVSRLYSLVPLFVVWTNMHGAALGGMATVALAVALWTARWVAGTTSPIRDGATMLRCATLVVACFATAFVNPYGLDLPRTWFDIMRSSAVSELIIEHGSLVRTGSWHVLPFAALFVAVFWTSRFRWNATPVIALVWLVLSFQRIRHAPLFAVAALIVFPHLLRGSGIATWLSRRGVDLSGIGANPGSNRRLVGVVVASLLAVAAVHRLPEGSRPALARLDRTVWPTDLLPALRRVEAESSFRTPILNETLFGGFLEYYTPGLATFSDDRCELFGDDFMRREYAGDPAWFSAWSSEHDVRLALVAPGSKLERFVKENKAWDVVASSPPAVLYRASIRTPGRKAD